MANEEFCENCKIPLKNLKAENNSASRKQSKIIEDLTRELRETKGCLIAANKKHAAECETSLELKVQLETLESQLLERSGKIADSTTELQTEVEKLKNDIKRSNKTVVLTGATGSLFLGSAICAKIRQQLAADILGIVGLGGAGLLAIRKLLPSRSKNKNVNAGQEASSSSEAVQ